MEMIVRTAKQVFKIHLQSGESIMLAFFNDNFCAFLQVEHTQRVDLGAH